MNLSSWLRIACPEWFISRAYPKLCMGWLPTYSQLCFRTESFETMAYHRTRCRAVALFLPVYSGQSPLNACRHSYASQRHATRKDRQTERVFPVSAYVPTQQEWETLWVLVEFALNSSCHQSKVPR